MKKFILSLGLVAAFTLSSVASTLTTTVASGIMTNLAPVNATKVTQIIVNSSLTNGGTFQIYDTPTNSVVYTNLAYTNIITYGTNLVTTWTNYYGRTNAYTNLSVVDVTNSVAATTNTNTLVIAGNLPTNAVVKYDNVNYYFTQGVWITNTGTAPLTFVVTYQQ